MNWLVSVFKGGLYVLIYFALASGLWGLAVAGYKSIAGHDRPDRSFVAQDCEKGALFDFPVEEEGIVGVRMWVCRDRAILLLPVDKTTLF